MSFSTLTYSESAEGWVSFYSFFPDWMIGMNNYFYSFKGGDVYRHSVNATRNNFYGEQFTSKIRSVFNDVPLENKLFKTMNIEGDDRWSATMITDLEFTGYIEASWFEKKEQSWYAFVRNSGIPTDAVPDYLLRSMNGIGNSLSVFVNPIYCIIDFSVYPLVDIGDIVSVGDYLYFVAPPADVPQYAGRITEIVRDYVANVNYIKTSTPSSSMHTILPNAYFMYVKDSVAESHGVLGHYCVFDIENVNTSKVELFTVESEVMKSYP
jgi:hypothetical protein